MEIFNLKKLLYKILDWISQQTLPVIDNHRILSDFVVHPNNYGGGYFTIEKPGYYPLAMPGYRIDWIDGHTMTANVFNFYINEQHNGKAVIYFEMGNINSVALKCNVSVQILWAKI